MTHVRLDRVAIFGDQLSFLIPHEWIEGEGETDHYLTTPQTLNLVGSVSVLSP